ncbi:aspartic proteinase nepenthesin-2-like [Corylus avellana]|uniref:aspartic proteinase nepenthesin-2-like n=1 Tax=Corylus avellana TaxID=13451 RepID=UPI00286A8D26|nr:aspartic proteinase nepenthesin-2-like [Corylus avellana]
MVSSSPFPPRPSSYSSANTTTTQSTFMSVVISPRPVGVGVYFIQIEALYSTHSLPLPYQWFRPVLLLNNNAGGDNIGLVFDTLTSTSLSVVPCDSAACNHLGCNNSQCQYKVDYMDGSFTKGVLVLEKLMFGGIGVLDVFFGCMHSNHGLVTRADGLRGGPLSLLTQLRLHGLVDIFNYCLSQGMVFGSPGWLNFSLPGALLHAGTASPCPPTQTHRPFIMSASWA